MLLSQHLLSDFICKSARDIKWKPEYQYLNHVGIMNIYLKNNWTLKLIENQLCKNSLKMEVDLLESFYFNSIFVDDCRFLTTVNSHKSQINVYKLTFSYFNYFATLPKLFCKHLSVFGLKHNKHQIAWLKLAPLRKQKTLLPFSRKCETW